jgi:hypothetical protein
VAAAEVPSTALTMHLHLTGWSGGLAHLAARVQALPLPTNSAPFEHRLTQRIRGAHAAALRVECDPVYASGEWRRPHALSMVGRKGRCLQLTRSR